MLCHQPFKSVPPTRIQECVELNKTCCQKGGACMLGSFCACPTPSVDATVSMISSETCGTVLRDTRLPRKNSMCK